MKLILISLIIAVAGVNCSNVKAQGVLSGTTNNTIYIDQVGSGNLTTVTQDGSGHSATVTTGSISPTDYNVFSIMQQGAAKTASIELKAGSNNTLAIIQDGTGNHTASIQNMIGSGNQIAIEQKGAGNHSFIVTNPNSATNNGNTVTATQSGGIGADKTFNLQFNGATGAGVTVDQTSTTANQAGFNIQCNPCLSGWVYRSQ
jgi:hypothetical protein